MCVKGGGCLSVHEEREMRDEKGEENEKGDLFKSYRQECLEITYMAMGLRPHSFPVRGMYVKGIGWLTKVEKKSRAYLSYHCFLNVKSTSQIFRVYLTG